MKLTKIILLSSIIIHLTLISLFSQEKYSDFTKLFNWLGNEGSIFYDKTLSKEKSTYDNKNNILIIKNIHSGSKSTTVNLKFDEGQYGIHSCDIDYTINGKKITISEHGKDLHVFIPGNDNIYFVSDGEFFAKDFIPCKIINKYIFDPSKGLYLKIMQPFISLDIAGIAKKDITYYTSENLLDIVGIIAKERKIYVIGYKVKDENIVLFVRSELGLVGWCSINSGPRGSDIEGLKRTN